MDKAEKKIDKKEIVKAKTNKIEKVVKNKKN